LLAFMQKNKHLGLVDERELLQSNAQLRAARLELESINRMWSRQRTSLNRLMGTSWDNEFVLRVETPALEKMDVHTLSADIEQYSPTLKQNYAQKMMAEAAIEKAKSDRKSKFDIITSVGSRTRNTSAGSNESGTSYGLMFEYQLPMDKSGFDARLYQARIDHDIAEDTIRQLKDDIRYNLSALLAELASSEKALRYSHSRLKLEQERYQEVKQRYQRGRADTSQMIIAEGELAFGEFSLQQQQIELAKRLAQLKLMRGTFWHAVSRNKE
ncbi:MAG: TolC family protein, partial [Gammaproteobacteria bacterium]|nr:TolC family protein [Gammaproteobacteria bacterium]